jgi:excisionase family DNA binding protein
MQKPLISILRLSRDTGICYKVSRRLVREGKVPTVQVGAQRRVPSEFVQAWIKGSSALSMEVR